MPAEEWKDPTLARRFLILWHKYHETCVASDQMNAINAIWCMPINCHAENLWWYGRPNLCWISDFNVPDHAPTSTVKESTVKHRRDRRSESQCHHLLGIPASHVTTSSSHVKREYCTCASIECHCISEILISFYFDIIWTFFRIYISRTFSTKTVIICVFFSAGVPATRLGSHLCNPMVAEACAHHSARHRQCSRTPRCLRSLWGKLHSRGKGSVMMTFL